MLSKIKIAEAYKRKTAYNRRFLRFSFRSLYNYCKLIFIIILIVCSLLLYNKKLPNQAYTTLEKYYYSFTAKYGLKLENVYLEGQNHTSSHILRNTLQLKIGQPILSISLNDLKKRLEAIDWIKYAIIERSFPNTLYIGIIERTPIALWQKAGKFYLIDETGKVIKEENLGKFSNFIVLIGEDAPLYAKSLINLISKESNLYNKISHAIRISERRWNIKFDNGLEIKLPEENPEAAWNYVIELFNKQNLFGKSISSIDLRIPNKLCIK